MNKSARLILIFSAVSFAIGLVSVTLFAAFHAKFLTAIPLFANAVFMLLAPMPASLGCLLVYIFFDGMLKVLSDYNPIVHVGSDLLVVLMTLRWLVDLGLAGRLTTIIRVPFFYIFTIHFAWVFVEVFNPFGIGFVAGVAAFKVYVTFLMLYFIVQYAIDDIEELKALALIAVLLIVPQTFFAIVQFDEGSKLLLQISPYYAKPMQNIFVDAFFRPFGFASTPGGAATWCFLTMPLITAFAAMSRDWKMRILYAALIVLSLYVLFISQVRASMIKAVIAGALTYTFIYLRKPLRLAWGATIGVLSFAAIEYVFYLMDNPLLQVAKDRYLALTNLSFITSQRGQGVISSIEYIWKNAPFGIGMSRVGAASTVFTREIASNQFYGSEWAFADNLYKAVTIELGAPGSIFYLALVFCPVALVMWRLAKMRKQKTTERYLISGICGLSIAMILGFWGSEGSLYLPDCAYFWIFIGGAVKFSGRVQPRGAKT